jgi:SAM-dependent methyltransferase
VSESVEPGALASDATVIDATMVSVPLPEGVTALSVHIDGHRVWTARADEAVRADDGIARLRWPPALAERLRGRALVEIRALPSDEVLARSEVVFDASPGGPDLTDDQGARLSLTKYGNLRAAFDSLARQTIDTYLDQAEAVLRALDEDCGRPAFLDYGTLLGAVRDGRMISHDLDIDIGYLSDATGPADAMRDSYEVERILRRRHKWRVQRKDGGLLQVFFPQTDQRRRNIDIFTAFFCDGFMYQVHDTKMPGRRDDILPLSEVTLEGRRMPAPSRPEVLLASLYGPGWRVPDPSFSYDSSVAQRTLRSWFVGPRFERDQWAHFYARRGDDVPTTPSDFARWVLPRTDAERLVDVGSGNGRDAVFFASQGRDVLALDAVPSALNRSRTMAHDTGVTLRARRLNLDSLRETLVAGALDSREAGRTDVYARFLVHCLGADSLEHFWRYTAMVLDKGGQAFLEFRTPADRGRPKHFAPRRHRFASPDDIASSAEAAGGRVVERHVGTGMAVLGEEDPHVCRMVVQWT